MKVLQPACMLAISQAINEWTKVNTGQHPATAVERALEHVRGGWKKQYKYSDDGHTRKQRLICERKKGT